MVSSDDGSGTEHMPLPLDWICSELVHWKDDNGTRVAVVEAWVDVLYSEGVYFEDSIRQRGMLPPEAVDAPTGIVTMDYPDEKAR